MLMALHDSARKGVVKFLIFGIMGLAVFGLLLMDVGGFFRGGIPSNTVATVAGRDINNVQFDNMLRRILAQQGLSVEAAYKFGLVERILQTEINNYLLQQAAFDYGIRIDDSLVKEQIAKIIAPYRAQGMSAENALNSILRSSNMSESAFVETIRSEMANTILREAIQLGGAAVREQEARDIYKVDHEKRTIEAVILPHDRITETPEATDEVLMPLYQAAQMRYAIPETRTLTVTFLTEDQMRGRYEISEEELREIYQDEIESYRLPERRVIQQAVFDTESEALEVIKAAKNGISLQKAVEEVTGSADSYMGEETYEEEGLVEEVANTAFNTKAGSTAGPVSSPLGWHALFVKEILPPETLPFEKVKEELNADIMHLRMADQMYELANAIDDQLAAGIPLNEVAAQFDLTLQEIGPVREDGSTPDDKEGMKDFNAETRDLILDTAFALLEEEVSPVTELPDGRFVIVRVDKVSARDFKPFEQVKQEIKDQWIKSQKRAENKLQATDAISEIRNGERTLEEYAAATGTEHRFITLDRSEAPEAPFRQRNRDNVFLLDQGRYFIEETNDAIIIGKVTKISMPADSEISSENIEPLLSALRRNRRNEALGVFLAHLRDKYTVKINKHLIETTYGPGGENF